MYRKFFTVSMLFLSVAGFAQDKMTPELLWKLGRVSGETLSPDGKKIIYGITKYNLEADKGNRDLYAIPVKGGDPVQLTNMEGSEYEAQYRPDGKKIGFISKGQIWEMNPDGSGAKQVTSIEGGISHFKYSPDGSKVAYTTEVKLDQNIHDKYPNLKKANAMVIDDLMYRHWDHWSDDKYSHVFVADYSNGAVTNAVDIMKGQRFDTPLQPFGGGEDFIWSRDGKSIVYVSKKLSGKAYATSTNSEIYEYDLASKMTKNLSDRFMGYDMQPSFSPDGKYLAWTSMARDGYESDKNDLVILNRESNERYIVTKPWDNTVSSFAWDAKSKKVYIHAGHEATYQLFELEITSKEGDKPKMITSGDHNIGHIIGQSGGNLIATQQDMNHANEIYSYNSSNGKSKQITHVNDKIYNSIKLSKIEKRWVNTFDDKKMLVWMIFPPDFDPKKKYPTLLYCQGGPQSAVSQFYSFRWNFQLMAAKGYIVVAPNRRGLPSFGKDWNEVISKDWGGGPMIDYKIAIDQASAEPYVDNDRLGAVGASYGGYSVYMLAGIHEGRFKSFISHCGLFNLDSWYGSTEELFFANWDIGGAYWQAPQPKSYQEHSPHKYVGQWDTPIMVIHGGKDFRVPENQGMEAFQAAQLKGIKSRFLYFPNEGHWVLRPQNGIIWHSEFFKWLKETL